MKILVFLIGLLIIVFLAIFCLVLVYSKRNDQKFCSYVLVLGAKILDENTPCKVLENRLICAIKYLNKFKDSKVIVSGGIGEDEPISEGFVMKKYLMKNGICEDRILIEGLSTNTFENLKNTKEILGGIDEILIITSNYHLFRAMILAKRIGFSKIYLIGSKVNVGSRQKNILREIFAIIKSIFFDW